MEDIKISKTKFILRQRTYTEGRVSLTQTMNTNGVNNFTIKVNDYEIDMQKGDLSKVMRVIQALLDDKDMLI